jgi:flagellin
VADVVNQLGIYQTQLSIREEILTQAINSNSSANSRIKDADFAKEQSNVIKLQILQQTAISALTQANLAPQSVLGFLQ